MGSAWCPFLCFANVDYDVAWPSAHHSRLPDAFHAKTRLPVKLQLSGGSIDSGSVAAALTRQCPLHYRLVPLHPTPTRRKLSTSGMICAAWREEGEVYENELSARRDGESEMLCLCSCWTRWCHYWNRREGFVELQSQHQYSPLQSCLDRSLETFFVVYRFASSLARFPVAAENLWNFAPLFALIVNFHPRRVDDSGY